MLERFGSSIRADKARAALLRLTQGKKTVLQYADEFQSYFAQLEEYDEAFYMTKFISDFVLQFWKMYLYSNQKIFWQLKELQKRCN